MFELDLRSRLPIYEQLIAKIKEMVISEVLKPEEQLPSVRVLAQQLTINPNTIQKAYRELERQGYIYTVKGKGNFVAPIITNIQNEKLKSLKEELIKVMSEAMYLGMKEEEIIEIISYVNDKKRGGSKND
ncbi:GntR family transcriptional regulator [Alkaliphilus peptidifermentans]|uniref:GntR family transcriptional regulator n=1 Tax=Alkaliphilus peptidifermentans DSM 18978 TaxID=1120976 RepID=A0A1G5GHW0_9FIRM|nr:GntR family transcriptional regulator [Alkaliphilus peptidifermentans]SCY50919.1 GntR family transcriptional regulator [Alkaliphilus peptidifermentans DSM 18978]